MIRLRYLGQEGIPESNVRTLIALFCTIREFGTLLNGRARLALWKIAGFVQNAGARMSLMILEFSQSKMDWGISYNCPTYETTEVPKMFQRFAAEGKLYPPARIA